jgi:hypothetical protein
VLRDVKLTGQFTNQTAAFTFTATAQVKAPAGGTLTLLSGGVRAHGPCPASRLANETRRWQVRIGIRPARRIPDHAPVQREGRSERGLEFGTVPRCARAPLQPITLRGLARTPNFSSPTAARPERKDDTFVSFLPADGAVRLSWKEDPQGGGGQTVLRRRDAFANHGQPGLMRQVALLDFKVMQGELSRVSLLLRGAGEVTRVQGDQVLAWKLEPVENSKDRRLVVQLNNRRKMPFSLQVQMQTPLGAFPQTADAMRLQPEGATRFAGHFRIVNEGAVRLEIAQASGLSQISPEQIPESDATRTALRATGSQRFAYRFSSAGLRAPRAGGSDSTRVDRVRSACVSPRPERTRD